MMRNYLRVNTGLTIWQLWALSGLVLALVWLSVSCSSGMPMPEANCLTPMPDEEISALYPKDTDIWPIEDCHAAYVAAGHMASGGHVSFTRITQIISVEQGQAKQVPSLYKLGDRPIWRVVLRGRMVFEFLPMPSGTPTAMPPPPAYGCMEIIMLADTPNYGSARTVECPPDPYPVP